MKLKGISSQKHKIDDVILHFALCPFILWRSPSRIFGRKSIHLVIYLGKGNRVIMALWIEAEVGHKYCVQ